MPNLYKHNDNLMIKFVFQETNCGLSFGSEDGINLNESPFLLRNIIFYFWTSSTFTSRYEMNTKEKVQLSLVYLYIIHFETKC